MKGAHQLERRRDLAVHRAFEQIDDVAPVGKAEHVANGGRGDAFGPAMRDRLVEQRQRVAHRALGDAGDQRQRVGLGRDALGGADPVRCSIIAPSRSASGRSGCSASAP